jgi:hypothetical protein
MTTSATKTKALCVATRCTSVDQFVAAFHRFCGDDQTFFVATMTSRPIGLETAFSIQLADKQPVLRGLCIVLDAWETPDNRYKRPGIRLGIKRLTPDSQLVFDRLQAASKAPGAITEVTPLPGPLPVAPVTAMPVLPPVLRPPAFSLRSGSPVLPSPRTSSPGRELPPLRATTATTKPPPLVPLVPPLRVPPVPAPAAVEPPPPSVEARAPAPSRAMPPDALGAPEAKLAPDRSGPAPHRSARRRAVPVTITRFQVALNVDAMPPPVDDVEFKPTELVPRPRAESSFAGEPEPSSDRPGELDAPSQEAAPNVAAAARAPDPAPGADLRTPGSAFVLPANPLHNLSDESLEGFVDCTLYEETGNFFHPATDGGGWNDEVADPPAARATPPASVPAMPFDTPPNLVVRSQGHTESLAVGPDDPLLEPTPEAAPSFALASPHDQRGASAAPWPEAASSSYDAAHARPGASPAMMPGYGHPGAGQPPAMYPTVDAAGYTHYTAFRPAAPPEPMHVAGAWPRWLAICGTAVAAIVLAFVIARLVRGAPRDEPAAVATGAAIVAPPAPPAPPAPDVRPGATAGARPSAKLAAVQDDKVPVAEPASGAAEPAGGAAEPAGGAAEPAGGAAEPPDSLQPEGDSEGEAASGDIPIVGSGPCRFTIATTPAGSSVRIDNQPMGPSPLTIDATCEKHKIEVSHARYRSLIRWVTLAADKPQQLDVNLPRPVHAVTVASIPPGAELSINGRRAGTTPTVVQMIGFATVNLKFTKAGFKSVTKKVYSKLARDRVFVKLLR